MSKIFPFFDCELRITSRGDFSTNDLNLYTPQILNSIKDPDLFLKKHESRQEEYLLTRSQASALYKKLTQKNCYYFPNLEDRSPQFPNDVVGSFSHSKEFVCTAMALKSTVRSIGIDIESLGRVNPKTLKVIQTDLDISTSPHLTSNELGTLLFSAKESFYKLLHPIIKRYFIFSDAAIVGVNLVTPMLTEIDGIKVIKSGEFSLQLLKELSLEFSPQSQSLFHGKWVLFDGFLLTVMELKYK